MITTGANSFEAMPATKVTSFRLLASPIGKLRSVSCGSVGGWVNEGGGWVGGWVGGRTWVVRLSLQAP